LTLSALRLTKRGTGKPLTEPVVMSPAARAAVPASTNKPAASARLVNAAPMLCLVTAIC